MKITKRQLRRIIREEVNKKHLQEGFLDDLKAGGQTVADTVTDFFSGKTTLRPTSIDKAEGGLRNEIIRYIASYVNETLQNQDFDDDTELTAEIKSQVQNAAQAIEGILTDEVAQQHKMIVQKIS